MKSLLIGSEVFSGILRVLVSLGKSGTANAAFLSLVMHWVGKFSDALRNHCKCLLHVPSVVRIRIADLFSSLYLCARHYAMAHDNAAAKERVIIMRRLCSSFLVNVIR